MILEFKMSQPDVIQFEQELRRNMVRVKITGLRGLESAANIILDDANEDVPVDSGALWASGKVTPSWEESAVFIGYGDSSTNYEGEPTRLYAGLRHETGGNKPENYKWLERNAMQNIDTILEEVGTALRRMSWHGQSPESFD